MDGRGAGVRGVFKGQGPWVSARKEGWEGRGDRGRTLLRGEASGVRLLGFGSAAGWNEMQGGGPGANYRLGGDLGPL